MNIEAIWKEYRQSLKAFLHKNVACPADVDDLLQEILIKTYHNLATIQETKKIKSWLFQVANNTMIDFYRKRGGKNILDGESLWFDDSQESVTQKLAPCIMPFIDQLADEEAQLLKAIEINGLSQKEYAEQHGIKYSTLKSRLQKSRRKLFAVFNQCCSFSIDQRGNVIDYEEKNPGCDC